MSSASSVRPPKRHRDEIDDKIEALSKVVNIMNGPKKSFLLAKQCNIKLKNQKLMALSRRCTHSETKKQSLVTEFDMMIAENDIEIEIESIRSCKKFRRTENRYLERLFQDPYIREKAYNSIPNGASTSWNTSAETTTQGLENTSQICQQNLSQTTPSSTVTMCNKSTNTDPVYILNVKNLKETNQPDNASISYMEETMSTVGDMSPNESMLVLEENASLVEAIMSPSNEPPPIEEIVSPIKENESPNKEILMQTGEHIQSKWFEKSFEIEHIINEKPEILPTQSGIESCRNSSVFKSTEKEYEHKSKKDHGGKKSSVSKPITSKPIEEIVTEQTLSEDPLIVSKINKSSKRYTKDAINVALPLGTNVALPEATMTFPYKNTCSSGKNTYNSVKSLCSTQNSFDKKSLAITNDMEMAVNCNETSLKKTDRKENNQNSKEILQQTVKSPREIAKKSRNSKDIQTNNSQRKSTTSKDLPKQSQDISAKSKDLSTKALDLSAKSQDLSAKSQDLSAMYAKSEYLSAKSKDLSTKSLELSAKSKYLITKSQKLSAKCMALSDKSQDLFAKCMKLYDKSKSSTTKKGHKSSLKKDRSKVNIYGQKSSSRNILNGEKALLCMTELVKKAKEKNAIQAISQEDLINGLFKDLMASKHIKLEIDNSSDKTASCHECGFVYEGHMCAYTIREILEQC